MSVADVCQEESGATEHDINEIAARIIPSSHEGKCMIYCVGRKTGMLHEDGLGDIEGLIQAIEPLKHNEEELYQNILEVGKECIEEVPHDGDHCNLAINYVKCARNKNKERNLELHLL
ncbi:odorant binding protein [Rhyzopertha dominica]|uniref:Odorant-binding protein 5 n=1 Tax=Rhyzopertha dominica TaxID=92692 RepID=A0A0X8T8R6_RHYDO|nr:odorant-binding protein 5 [Rhyzopertha dominica]KAI7815131.1 odorant binding protein [Rhyzopertha dominica]